MGKVSKISYVDSSWSPWYGCTKVSEACVHCYAEAQMTRFGRDFSVVTRAASPTFYAPTRWKEPRRIFVCEWSDFFHLDADEWRWEAWEVIRKTPQHTYLILTKRPELMRGRISVHAPLNVWHGVTAENQEQTDKRLPILFDAPAALHFVSIEPMLEPISLGWTALTLLDWVIVGGESGPHRREMKVEWLEDIVDQCKTADVPVFVKQGSALWPGRQGDIPDHLWALKEIPGA